MVECNKKHFKTSSFKSTKSKVFENQNKLTNVDTGEKVKELEILGPQSPALYSSF